MRSLCNVLLNSQIIIFLQGIEKGVSEHKDALDKAKEIKEEVVATTNDPVMAADLDEQLTKLDDRLNALDSKAKDRKSTLEGVISQGDAFESEFDDFLKWLTKAERQQAGLRPISADVDMVKHQKDDYQVRLEND